MSGDSAHPLAALHRLVWTALLAAGVAAGAFLQLPIGPVPVSMQPFFVFLTGYVLGPGRGALAVALYVFAGAVGLPVFAGGASGLGRALGPTGGYLFGFIAAAAIAGLATNRAGRDNSAPSWARLLLFGAAALAATYGLGAFWLKQSMGFSWTKALAAGVAPFILWDVAKLAAAASCYRFLLRQGLAPR